MNQKAEGKKTNKVKQFFSQLLNKVDKKMEEKAKSRPCCCKPVDKESGSCCS
jgi:hypothetical protein